jgi:hypothetical protein
MNAPEVMYVRGKANGAMGRWHDATESEETAKITSGGDNPMYRYIRADLYDAQAAENADLRRQLAEARDTALEEAAAKAEREGVYSELNVWNGGPEWYRHGKRIASAIRALKGDAK